MGTIAQYFWVPWCQNCSMSVVDDRTSPSPFFHFFSFKAFYDIFSILFNLIFPVLKIQAGQFWNTITGPELVGSPSNHFKVVLSQFSTEIGMFSTRDWRDDQKLSRQRPPGVVQRLSPVPSPPAQIFSLPSRPASRENFFNPVPANPADVSKSRRRIYIYIQE